MRYIYNIFKSLKRLYKTSFVKTEITNCEIYKKLVKELLFLGFNPGDKKYL